MKTQNKQTSAAEIASPRPPNARSQGRKPIDPAGELMKNRHIRMTEAQWAHCKAVGGSAWVRQRIEADMRACALGVATTR